MSVSNILTGSPPLANYGVLTGQMFLYARGRAAFESCPTVVAKAAVDSIASSKNPQYIAKAMATTAIANLSPKKCILLGGLSDGMLPVPYTSLLEDMCHEHQWSLVQPILSSSYLGFGNGSLDRDVQELEELIEYLTNHRNGREYAIVGHSTGCQDAVHFLNNAGPLRKRLVSRIALQAPVSDREGFEKEENAQGRLEYAQEFLKAGKGNEMLPRSFHWAPITAQRFVDLHARNGKDDYFSSDSADAELGEKLGGAAAAKLFSNGGNYHPDLKVLVAFSGSDQYVPAHVDKPTITQRLVNALNGQFNTPKTSQTLAEELYIPNGDHNLSNPNDAKIFVDRIGQFLASSDSGSNKLANASSQVTIPSGSPSDPSTNKPVLTFVTGNAKKLEEAKQILGGSSCPFELTNQKIDLPELQGNPVEIAMEKCRLAARAVRGPVFTEDTSLCFNALNELPGPYIKWFLDKCGHDGLNKMLDGFADKTAYAQTIVAYTLGPGQEVHVFDGRTNGTIVQARGPLNFGWDPIFEPFEGHGRTYAEMDSLSKNAISHRGRSFAKFQAYLASGTTTTSTTSGSN